MSCCISNKHHSTESTVSPMTICASCAEKHIGTALSYTFSLGGWQSRHRLLGELMCAQRHLGQVFGDAELYVRIALKGVLFRYQDWTSCIRKAAEVVDKAAFEMELPEVPLPLGVVNPVRNPIIGELLFGSAFSLYMEDGYRTVNRPLIIGDLRNAEQHMAALSKPMADKFRSLRHTIQTPGGKVAEAKWLELSKELEKLILPALNDIKTTYGMDIWK